MEMHFARPSSLTVEALGARIKRLRMERKLTQDRLSIQANVDQSGLSKLERGKGARMGEVPLRRIAAVLQVTYEELIDGTDYPK